MNRLQKLAIAAAAATIVLFGVGGLVRGSGSGLGCTSWPKCGPDRWLPYPNLHSIIEYTHRMFVVVVTALVAAVAVLAWRRHRDVPGLLRPALAAPPLVIAQAVVGGIVVRTGLNPWWVMVHFAVAMLFVADVVYLATNSVYLVRLPPKPAVRGTYPAFARLSLLVAGAAGALLLVGTYVRATGAGLAFTDWPLMNGRLVPALGGIATAMFAHRVLAALVFLFVLYVAIRARSMASRSRDLVVLSTLTLTLLGGEILVGGATVLSRRSEVAVTGHVALSVLIWASLVALATVSRRLTASAPRGERSLEETGPDEDAPRPSLTDTVTAFVRLTKPRIILLLLVTTVPAMILAKRGFPSPWLVLATLVGGAIAAGSANVVNMYLDRDIDEIMSRTRGRPLPAHVVTPEQTLAFGFALGAVSFFFLAVTVNVLAASLALSAIAFYVFVYTMWLKRTTTQNIVIGGAAGAVPALVGWAAVTGTVGLPAWVLFAIVFVWTPPHFWALAMRYRGDYAAAGVPMLPVVKGEDETRRQIFLYSLVLFGTTLLLYPIGHMGPVYLGTAVGLGGVFVWRALVLRREATPARAWSLFKYSVWYLAALFVAVAVDRLVPLGH